MRQTGSALMNIEQLGEQGITIVEGARKIVISDQRTYDLASAQIDICNDFLKQVSDLLDPIVIAANTAHKTATSQRNKARDPFQMAKGILVLAQGVFDRKQKQIEEDDRRKRQVEADKEAEKLKAKEVKAAKAEGATRGEIKEIEKADHSVDVPAYAPTFTRRAGSHTRLKWTVDVEDLKKAIRSVHLGVVPMDVLQFNQANLDAWAKSTQGRVKVPGLKVFQRNIDVSR